MKTKLKNVFLMLGSLTALVSTPSFAEQLNQDSPIYRLRMLMQEPGVSLEFIDRTFKEMVDKYPEITGKSKDPKDTQSPMHAMDTIRMVMALESMPLERRLHMAELMFKNGYPISFSNPETKFHLGHLAVTEIPLSPKFIELLLNHGIDFEAKVGSKGRTMKDALESRKTKNDANLKALLAKIEGGESESPSADARELQRLKSLDEMLKASIAMIDERGEAKKKAAAPKDAGKIVSPKLVLSEADQLKQDLAQALAELKLARSNSVVLSNRVSQVTGDNEELRKFRAKFKRTNAVPSIVATNGTLIKVISQPATNALPAAVTSGSSRSGDADAGLNRWEQEELNP